MGMGANLCEISKRLESGVGLGDFGIAATDDLLLAFDREETHLEGPLSTIASENSVSTFI